MTFRGLTILEWARMLVGYGGMALLLQTKLPWYVSFVVCLAFTWGPTSKMIDHESEVERQRKERGDPPPKSISVAAALCLVLATWLGSVIFFLWQVCVVGDRGIIAGLGMIDHFALGVFVMVVFGIVLSGGLVLLVRRVLKEGLWTQQSD